MTDDRAYVLRVLEDSGETRYIPVTVFDRDHYACGLVAGDRLRLRQDFPVLDDQGRTTGKTHQAGEIWEVLTGAAVDPEVLWLRQPDGQLHGWDDDAAVFETFERLGSEAV